MTQQLDTLACQFFKLFAQYEYALKAMQFVSAGTNRQAEPSWDRFANEIGVLVMSLEDHQVAMARQYILEHPPKRQIWVNNALQWEIVPNDDQSVQALFGHIRRVRNNLYHGGKFNGRWIDPDRSQELIGASLCILRALVNADAKLSEAIQGNAS